jgi:hypothetical protein
LGQGLHYGYSLFADIFGTRSSFASVNEAKLTSPWLAASRSSIFAIPFQFHSKKGEGISMHPLRSVLFLLVLFSTTAICAFAQRPGPEFWRRVGCEPLEPRTKLEALEDRQGTVIIKGFARITTVTVSGVRIDAIEMKESGNVGRAKGIVVVLREGGERPREGRAFVDYEEVDSLLKAIDVLSGVDENATKLVGFEAHYRTHGDLELRVFRQTRSGTAVTISTGLCENVNQALTLDEFAKVKAMIQEAKARLDELR